VRTCLLFQYVDGGARVRVELVEEEVVWVEATTSYGLNAGSGESRTLKVTMTCRSLGSLVSPASLPRSMRASWTSETNRSTWPRRTSTVDYFVPSPLRKYR